MLERLLPPDLGIHVADADDDLVVAFLHANDLRVDVPGLPVDHQTVGGGEAAAVGKTAQQPFFVPHGQGLVQILRVHQAHHVAPTVLKEIRSALLHAQFLEFIGGAVFHKFIGLGVDQVNAEIVLGQGHGDAGEGDALALGFIVSLLALHLRVHVVHANDDVGIVLVRHAGGLHVGIGGHAVEHEPVGDGEGALLGKLPQQVFLGKGAQEAGQVVGVHHAQHVLAA